MTDSKSSSLTPKQSAFVDEYLVDLNATQAAIRAGYSEKTAKEQGCQNLTKLNIVEAIAEAQAERSERTKIDADWVLTRLAAEAEADLADLYESDGTIKSIHDWPMVWRQGLVAGMDVDEIKVGSAPIGSTKKIKISDRVKRLELIGKHVAVRAFAERHEHTGKDGGPIDVRGQSEEEIDRRLAELEIKFGTDRSREAGKVKPSGKKAATPRAK